MYLRRWYRRKDGKRHAYWALVESDRTARGPRQRVVAYLGELDERGRLGVQRRASRAEPGWQAHLFEDRTPEWVEVEHGYENSALAELLGVPAEKVNEDRLYRTLDRLLPHKEALEKHLKQRLGELFQLDYDLLLYDVTSTYFEGDAAANPQAQRGYSRDHRPDCKQVNIALVVSRSGLPLGYEVFAGNRSDVTTVEEIVEAMEKEYGQANRIWVMDRGMVSAENVEFLKQGGRRYILGTAKGLLRKFERQLLESDWREVHEGLDVKLCPAPEGDEVFIL